MIAYVHTHAVKIHLHCVFTENSVILILFSLLYKACTLLEIGQVLIMPSLVDLVVFTLQQLLFRKCMLCFKQRAICVPSMISHSQNNISAEHYYSLSIYNC